MVSVFHGLGDEMPFTSLPVGDESRVIAGLGRLPLCHEIKASASWQNWLARKARCLTATGCVSRPEPLEPLSALQLNSAIHAAAEAAGIGKWISMHSLRHDFATYLLEQKVGIPHGPASHTNDDHPWAQSSSAFSSSSYVCPVVPTKRPDSLLPASATAMAIESLCTSNPT